MKIFLKNAEGYRSDDDAEVDVEETSFIREADEDYDMQILKKAKTEFPYEDTSHVAGASAIVEQLFSRCGSLYRAGGYGSFNS